MKQWYEVFQSDDTGTHTVATCDTIEEALREMRRRNAKYHTPHYVDKWEDIHNPRIIRDIELEEALRQ